MAPSPAPTSRSACVELVGDAFEVEQVGRRLRYQTDQLAGVGGGQA